MNIKGHFISRKIKQIVNKYFIQSNRELASNSAPHDSIRVIARIMAPPLSKFLELVTMEDAPHVYSAPKKSHIVLG